MPLLALNNIDHADPFEYLHVQHQALDEVLNWLGEDENVIRSSSWIIILRITHNFSVALAKRAENDPFNLNYDANNQIELRYLQTFDAENAMTCVS
jgi:hypothetical protein